MVKGTEVDSSIQNTFFAIRVRAINPSGSRYFFSIHVDTPALLSEVNMGETLPAAEGAIWVALRPENRLEGVVFR